MINGYSKRPDLRINLVRIDLSNIDQDQSIIVIIIYIYIYIHIVFSPLEKISHVDNIFFVLTFIYY